MSTADKTFPVVGGSAIDSVPISILKTILINKQIIFSNSVLKSVMRGSTEYGTVYFEVDGNEFDFEECTIFVSDLLTDNIED